MVCKICQGDASDGQPLSHPLGLIDSTAYVCGDCAQRVAEEWPRCLMSLARDAAIIAVAGRLNGGYRFVRPRGTE